MANPKRSEKSPLLQKNAKRNENTKNAYFSTIRTILKPNTPNNGKFLMDVCPATSETALGRNLI